MGDGKVYGVSEMAIVLPTASSSFRVSGSKLTVNKENMDPSESEESNGEDYYGGLRQPGKKRRLTVNQVECLETNFELENKLEPERKVELAKKLGLQPRQVAIWFQNKRARFKTKQLEEDYGSLNSSYEKLMSDYDNLLKENEALKTDIDELKEELAKRAKRTKKKGNLEPREAMGVQVAENQIPFSKPDSDQVCNLPTATGKQEEASSDKSDMFDSEGPPNAENHWSLMEAANSSQSDFSQDDEDNFTGTLFPTYLPKLEADEEFPESCSFGFPADEETFCSFWPYLS